MTTFPSSEPSTGGIARVRSRYAELARRAGYVIAIFFTYGESSFAGIVSS